MVDPRLTEWNGFPFEQAIILKGDLKSRILKTKGGVD